jgi:hypothetical protein
MAGVYNAAMLAFVRGHELPKRVGGPKLYIEREI